MLVKSCYDEHQYNMHCVSSCDIFTSQSAFYCWLGIAKSVVVGFDDRGCCNKWDGEW